MSLPGVDDARAAMVARIDRLPGTTVPLTDANGRVLRAAVTATRDQPPFAVSAMDGWAVRRADLPGALVIVGESAAGHGWAGTLRRGEAVRISTGAAIPDESDWVVIQEEAERAGDRVRLGQAGASGFVRAQGADFARGDTLLAAGTRLDPWRIALVASAGLASVTVSARPRVALAVTGDELAAPGAVPGTWQIHDSVGPGLAAWFGRRGCDVALVGPLPDDRAKIGAALFAAPCDLLVTIGGASVGDHDLVKPACHDLGLDMIVEGVAVRPGKPTWFGRLGDGRPVLGLPGNPVSAMVCAELFAAPILAALEGAAWAGTEHRARLAGALAANGPRDHFMRATLSHDPDGALVATIATDQDSSLVSVLAGAGGLVRQRAGAPAVAAGETVEILLLDRG